MPLNASLFRTIVGIIVAIAYEMKMLAYYYINTATQLRIIRTECLYGHIFGLDFSFSLNCNYF